MRAIFTIMASLSVCSGLLGCDQNEKASAPAPVVVAAAPACSCQHQAQAAPVPVVEPPHLQRHHHYRRHQHDMAYEASWQGGATSGSSYSESRESEYAGEGHESVDEQGSAAYPPPPPDAGSGVWVDGHGRSHYASEAAETDDNPAALSAEDDRRRSDPWRGFNSKCRNAVD
jgi:hypothetical protein